MTNEVDLILQKAQKLSPDETLSLIQRLAAGLRLNNSPKVVQQNRDLREGVYFGKYANHPGPETTEEDFKAAEYHFNEDEWK